MAGGKGTRLAPYTTVLPKPLLPIDSTPILEIILRQLKRAGITRITLAVGHLGHLLENFFGDGQALGLSIDYHREKKPLGTAGPLVRIGSLDGTFLVMNGDILTDLDYRKLVAYHRRHKALATIGSYERKVPVDFGVIETNSSARLQGYREKPVLAYDVSMGVYVFEPEVLKFIPKYRKFDFPELVWALLQRRKKVISYPYGGIWYDIGRPDDYARATAEFLRHRKRFFV